MARTKITKKTDQSLEFYNPEKAAEAIDLATDPYRRLADVAETAKMPLATVKALINRVRNHYQPVHEELKRVKDNEIIELLRDRTGRALGYLDDYSLSSASAKDLAITIGILIEKTQLLEGKPTQILSVEERRHINDLLPAVIREAQRRGHVIDVSPDGGTRLIHDERP